MSKCEWCNRESDNISSIIDDTETLYNICDSCKSKYENKKCIRCNQDVSIAYKGLCINCLQVRSTEYNKLYNEIIEDDIIESNENMSESFFNDWMTKGDTFTKSDFKTNKTLRRIWILLKLRVSGITDNEIIKNNYSKIDDLVRLNADKINKNCYIKINNTDGRNIIANIDNIYIVS